MTRLSKLWVVLAALFAIVNLVYIPIHAAEGEPLYAAVHLLLALVGAYGVWRLVRRRDGHPAVGHESLEDRDTPHELTNRLTHLEQSVDAVAIEVERIGEGQRFMNRVFAERGTPRAAGEAGAEPVEAQTREPARPDRRD
jgi:hypothetical protein